MTTYKIIEFHETTGQLIVEFDPNMAPLSIDIPLDSNNLFIVGEALDSYIKGFIPTWHLERLAALANGISNASEIKALVQPTTYVSDSATFGGVVNTPDPNMAMWTQVEFEQKVAELLVKFNVLQTNPTTIPTANL